MFTFPLNFRENEPSDLVFPSNGAFLVYKVHSVVAGEIVSADVFDFERGHQNPSFSSGTLNADFAHFDLHSY